MEIHQIGDLHRDHFIIEVSDDFLRAISIDGCSVWVEAIQKNFPLKQAIDQSVAQASLRRLLLDRNLHGRSLLKDCLNRLEKKTAPYSDFEICHCRVVPTSKVIQSIWYGARTTDDVARACSAGTACGTCRPDSQKMIDFLCGE